MKFIYYYIFCIFIFTCISQNVDLDLLENAGSLFLRSEKLLPEILENLPLRTLIHYGEICKNSNSFSQFCLKVIEIGLTKSKTKSGFLKKKALFKFEIEKYQEGSLEVRKKHFTLNDRI